MHLEVQFQSTGGRPHAAAVNRLLKTGFEFGQSATSEMKSSSVYENLAERFQGRGIRDFTDAVLFGSEQLTIWKSGSKLRGGLFQGRY